MFIPQQLYGVIGWPLAQTLSPLIHNTAFQLLDIEASYLAWPISKENLASFIEAFRLLNIKGCSITIPHKIAIIPYLESLSKSAKLAGAVNTIFWKSGQLNGDNTDVTGFMAPLNNINLPDCPTLLLGAGGAAHAAAAGLKLLGFNDVAIVSPSNKHQFDLANKFNYNAYMWEDRYSIPVTLIINATPLGMKGKLELETPYNFKLGTILQDSIAYDLVYNPLQTRFINDAKKEGLKTISGMEMFFWQGDAQFYCWTGHHFPQEVKSALIKALQG